MKGRYIIPLVTLSLTSLAAADPVILTVHTDQITKTVSTGIYGQFLEHIFNSVHGGLWGDQILNGTLELRPARSGRGRGPAPATAPTAAAPRNWEFVGDANQVTNDSVNPLNASNSVHSATRGRDSGTPNPTIVGDQAGTTGAVGVELAIARNDGGGVVNLDLAVKGERG